MTVKWKSLISFLFLNLLLFYSVGNTTPKTLFITSPSDSLTLQRTIEKANPGDSIIVQGGHFRGTLNINKSITLIGKNNPIIDGKFKNSVVKISAPEVTIEGFIIQNSGDILSREDAGISVNAPRATLINNTVQNVLFGIYLRKSHNSVIKNNIIIGKKQLAIPRRGDLIRVWYSNLVDIENNVLQYGRDVIIWFSNGSLIKNNQVTGARYGLHFMYSDSCTISHNLLMGNSVGSFLMYSKRLKLVKNTIAYNRGPSGFGIGLKDFDNGVLSENIVFDNRIGVYIDNSPRLITATMRYEKNVLAYNDVGVNIFPYIHRSFFIENSFIDNYQQVNVEEGTRLTGDVWKNNYWSDYVGYDLDGDGVGDLPYKSEKLYENLMAKNPELRLFIYSPAIEAVNFAAKAFPLIKPIPAFEDHQPKVKPYIPKGLPTVSLPPRLPLLMATLGMVFSGLFIMWFFGRKKTAFTIKHEEPNHYIAKEYNNLSKKLAPIDGEKSMLSIQHLNKSFGKNVVLRDISFTVREGESIALFGENGAGKTTVIRCILGLLTFGGEIRVNRFDVKKDLKSVRRLIGFVPQEINIYNDLTVEDTIEFFSKLKKTTHNAIDEWIQRLGLDALRKKKVGELSGGMKQRLALILAMISDPPILLLDEPTANLDVHSRREFLDLIKGLRDENKTILFASHRLDEISALASRVLILKAGELISDCSPGEIYDKLGKQFLLKIHIPSQFVNPAVEALQKEGFQASKNENGIKIPVEADKKAEPITFLIKNDIPVNDFDYEILNGSEFYE